MLAFKQFSEQTEKVLEKDPQKGFIQLKEEMLPIYTRNYEYFILDKKTSKMKMVAPEKIVHPQKK